MHLDEFFCVANLLPNYSLVGISRGSTRSWSRSSVPLTPVPA